MIVLRPVLRGTGPKIDLPTRHHRNGGDNVFSIYLGANYIAKTLKEVGVLDKALATYPDYGLIVTGHSLGAGVACLLALKIRYKYPEVKVYAFSTPGK